MKLISLLWVISIGIFFYCNGSLYVAAPPKVDVFFDGTEPLFYINKKLLFYVSAAFILLVNLLLHYLGRRSAMFLPLFYKSVNAIHLGGTMQVARQVSNFRFKYVFRLLATVVNLFVGYFLYELYIANGNDSFQPMISGSIFFYLLLGLFLFWIGFFVYQLTLLSKEIKQNDLEEATSL